MYISIILELRSDLIEIYKSICYNADGPRDAASHKIDRIARPTKYNYQATSVG